ncbi:hypothetical protein [Nocardia mangyaensis]|uniref:hypothetical protein n=1 Tax=Nocardia mangyaensis TaxID=2213200 RepID=UPI00267560C2|nr:hypothetical protein [Nocardia mangyaensis]MDO3645877.1 hypothetical protein [Nocardia mangyaensis]
MATPATHPVRLHNPAVSMRWYQLCSDKYCEQIIDTSTQYVYEGGTFVNIPGDGSVRSMINTGVKLKMAD